MSKSNLPLGQYLWTWAEAILVTVLVCFVWDNLYRNLPSLTNGNTVVIGLTHFAILMAAVATGIFALMYKKWLLASPALTLCACYAWAAAYIEASKLVTEEGQDLGPFYSVMRPAYALFLVAALGAVLLYRHGYLKKLRTTPQ